MSFFGWATWATDATMYFSSHQYGQNRITNIQEGNRIWIAVYDPDENIDCDARDKIFPDISLMDPKTGARLNWNNTGDLGGDYLEETSDDSGLFISSRYFRIGARTNVALKDWTHNLGDLVGGADLYSGGVYTSLGVTGRVENMDTVYGMYQDPNDSTDVAVTMAKIIDTEATISWDQLVYMDSHGSATITIVDSDENLYLSEMEEVPVFIIVNPGSWNPVRESSPTNFCMLKRFGGIDPMNGSVVNEPIRWHNIYNSGLGGPYPNNSQLTSAGAYYIEYATAQDSNRTMPFNTTDLEGFCRVMFYARETGFDTGVFQLRLDDILSALGFDSLEMRDVLAAYYMDPNDFDDFKLATAYIEECQHSVTSFTDETRVPKSVYWIGRNPVYVQVIDANANVNPCCDPEQVVVHICDPHGEDDSEWIILDETSSNSPIFFTQARMPLLPVWDALGLGIPGPGGWQLQLDNWKLEGYNEDSICVRYNDVYYTQDAINSLGDSDSNTAFPPEIAAVRVANDVSFDVVEVADTQVYEGSTLNLYFLDRQGDRVTGYVNSDCALIEVIDPDQNEDVDHRDRIDAFWDGQQDTPFGPMDFEDNHAVCGHGYNDVQVHPVNPLLGDTNIFGTGYSGNPSNSTSWAKVYVLNPRNGRWAAVDLLETGVNTGHFISVTCIDLVSVYDYVPTLGVFPGDTILAYYQDPSNHSDFAVGQIKVHIGGPDYPPALIQNFTATNSENSRSTLCWNNPPDTDLAEVVVRRKADHYPADHNDGDTAKQYTSPTPAGSLEYIDTGLTNGTTYYYAVFSCDTAGHWNDQVVEGKNADTGKPDLENPPPETVIVNASISGNTVTFTWSGSDDTTLATKLTYSYRLVRPGPAYDAWSSWISGKTKKYMDLSSGNYKFQVRARDKDGAIDPSPASKEFVIEETENHSPIVRASDINGQPKDMYPDTVYTVTAKYFDPDGREDLKHCYLRLDQPLGGKDLTMMWYQADGHAAPWAGEEGGNYLAQLEATATETTDTEGNEGYQITWTFQINDQWPAVEDAIDFGVFASDGGGLESDWNYDDTGASFVLRFFNPELSIPVCAPMMQDAHLGTTLTFAFTVQNNGNQTDTINLSFEDQFNWDISLSTSSVTLPPEESYTVYLLVTVSDHAVDRISITGKSVGDSSKSSSCVIRASGHDNVALFMVKATFSNSTTGIRTLRFEIPDYVKMSEQSITLNAASTATVAMLFDPGRQDARFHSFELKIDDLQTGGRAIIETNFNTDEIIATNFHMPKHSYNFPNFGLWKLTCCFGMSETSILYFEGAIKLPNGVSKTYDLEKDQVKRLIVWYQWRALRSTWDGLMVRLPSAKPSEEYQILEQNIRAGHPMIIAIKNHAVVGYKIVRRGPVSYILIYDNELPLGTDTSLVDTAFSYATYNHETHVFNYAGLDKFLAIKAVKRILDLVVPAVECPVDVTITDQYGRNISNTGTNDIPGADVWMDETGEIKIFYLPPSLNYRARFDAYAEGSFTLTIFLPCTDETAYVSAFNAVSIEEGGNAELTFTAGSPASTMTIDRNNDGITDEMKDPTTAEVDQSESEPIAPVVPPLQSITNGPNPVPDTGTAFFYTLPDGTSTAKLMIFNVTGQPLFETPLDADSSRFPSAGTWNPVDQDGIPLANGPYIYVLIADGRVIGQGKMVIQR